MYVCMWPSGVSVHVHVHVYVCYTSSCPSTPVHDQHSSSLDLYLAAISDKMHRTVVNHAIMFKTLRYSMCTLYDVVCMHVLCYTVCIYSYTCIYTHIQSCALTMYNVQCTL